MHASIIKSFDHAGTCGKLQNAATAVHDMLRVKMAVKFPLLIRKGRTFFSTLGITVANCTVLSIEVLVATIYRIGKLYLLL